MKYHCVNYAICLLLWAKVGLTFLYSTCIPQAQKAVINWLVMYHHIEDYVFILLRRFNIFQNSPLTAPYSNVWIVLCASPPLLKAVVKMLHIMVMFHFVLLSYKGMGRDSADGIATRYGLDGPGNEIRCSQDNLHPSRPTLGLTQSPIQWVPGLSRG
jgi:hypothetical protein